MRRVLNPRSVLVMPLLAGCSAELPTSPDDSVFRAQTSHQVETQASHHDARPAVPIRGTCETEMQPPEPVGPGVIRQLDVGTCRISHLGKSTLVSDKLINL